VRLAVALLAVVLTACAGAEAKGSIPDAPPALAATTSTLETGPLPLAPLTPTDPNRIAPEERAAIDALAAISSPLFPTNGHGHTHGAPATQATLDATDQPTFDRQWAQAVAAAEQLDTVAKANAAGYVVASTNAAGVGVHFVKWSLVDKPFDPATPSMLLFDLRRDPPVLVGFSYWVHSTGVPAGFAGDNDHWHQHSGLCIVNGWVDRENVAGPSLCAGAYLGGSDLWMLHAWVVPGYQNRWGEFADTNPLLCPPVASTADIAQCPSAP